MEISWISPGDRGAEWIAPRLGEFGTVGGNVPLGFESYVTVPNADPGTGPAFSLLEPFAGTGRSRMDHLVDLLSPGDQDCWFAVWVGHGGGFREADGGVTGLAIAVAWDGDGPAPTPQERERAGREALAELSRRLPERPPSPHLSLPFRDYYLLRVPLADAVSAWGDLTPTLFWPADRTWFVATDLDSGSTAIGGPRELLAPLTRAPWRGRWTSPEQRVWFVPEVGW